MPSKIFQRTRLFIFSFLSPIRIFVLSFATTIMIGTILLSLSVSTTSTRLPFIDALFTATSGVCVTGLAVIDIGKDLSLFGQIITLILFQCGGIGIITFSVFFFRITGSSISFKERELIQTTFLHKPQRDFYTIARSVLIQTAVIECIGICLLFIRFFRDLPFKRALYSAIYHAISAFNNCGYSLFSNNLEDYKADPLINITVMSLIVLGGIGFVVIHEVIARLRGLQKRLSIHTRIVIFTSLALIISGAAFFYIFERDNIIKDMPIFTTIMVSFFQSITPRTCGFNTVNIGGLTNETILLLMMLMFIGASPGSTGGGIKTTSFSLLFLLLWNRLKGNEEVNIFNRTIPKELITRSIFIIFASIFSIVIITSIVLFAAKTNAPPMATRHLFIEYLFEAISAFGTVGLSMGVTPHMNGIQKLAIIILMFAGRVGPLTLALSIAVRRKKRSIVYAEEQVMVG